jgi:hypothetical protein
VDILYGNAIALSFECRCIVCDCCERWPGLAGLVPGERIDAAAEDLGGLALVEGDIRLHSL